LNGAVRADSIVITGATATGKTALSIAVAQALSGEIISMDSRQVYRGLDIGTAKPSPAMRHAVTHHGLDLVDPGDRYSAGQFARDARVWLKQIRERGNLPLLVGGTGFFLKALTDPMFIEPELPTRRREALKRWLSDKSTDELVRWLTVLDPGAATRLTRGGGRQRQARALEIVLLTGRPLAWWQQASPPAEPAVASLVFVLEQPREDLYRRINSRVVEMTEAGLVEEVRGLLERGYDEKAPGLNATGYIELIPYLRGQTDLASAIDAIQRATRRYARRQHTWFRHQLPPGAIRLDACLPMRELVDTITAAWQRSQEPRGQSLRNVEGR
jgi:tRNA dimethylallyltransferase